MYCICANLQGPLKKYPALTGKQIMEHQGKEYAAGVVAAKSLAESEK